MLVGTLPPARIRALGKASTATRDHIEPVVLRGRKEGGEGNDIWLCIDIIAKKIFIVRGWRSMIERIDFIELNVKIEKLRFNFCFTIFFDI